MGQEGSASSIWVLVCKGFVLTELKEVMAVHEPGGGLRQILRYEARRLTRWLQGPVAEVGRGHSEGIQTHSAYPSGIEAGQSFLVNALPYMFS